MGAFDGVTNTRIGVHIFAGEGGDYYTPDDSVPIYATVPPSTVDPVQPA